MNARLAINVPVLICVPAARHRRSPRRVQPDAGVLHTAQPPLSVKYERLVTC